MSFDFSRSAADQGLDQTARKQFYAQEAALRSAHAHVITKAHMSQLDAQVKQLAPGFLKMQPSEKSELVGARVAGHEGVKALLLQVCSAHSDVAQAQKAFMATLTQKISASLPTEYDSAARRQEKSEKIVSKVMQDLEATGAFEEAWSVASARREALKFADGQLEVAGGERTVLRQLVSDTQITDSDLADAVATRCKQDIQQLNIRRCQEHGSAFQSALDHAATGSLVSTILSQINSRGDSRASKTSEKIAAEIVDAAASSSIPSVKALRHPIAQLWSDLSIASGTMVSLAEVRLAFVKSLASQLHDTKGYTEEDSLRKAEHIFIDLCKGMDEPGVVRYTKEYMESLHIDADSFRQTPAVASMPVDPIAIRQHLRAQFEEHRNSLGVTDSSIAPKFVSSTAELSAKDVAADILARSDKGICLWARALFAQERTPTLTETENCVKAQLRAAFSPHQIAVYEAQKQAYDAAGTFARIGKGDHAKDPAERFDEWLGKLTDIVCQKLQHKDLTEARVSAETDRERFGDLQGVRAERMDAQMVHASASAYQEAALDNYRQKEEALSKIIVRALPTDGRSLSADSLLGRAHAPDLRELHRAYYERLDTRSDAFGFDLDMSLALTRALEKSFPSTPEGREKCRTFVRDLLAHMKTLIGQDDIPGLVRKYVKMRPWKAQDLQAPTSPTVSARTASSPRPLSMVTQAAALASAPSSPSATTATSTPKSPARPAALDRSREATPSVDASTSRSVSGQATGAFETALDAEAAAREETISVRQEEFRKLFENILTNTEKLIRLAAGPKFSREQRRDMLRSLISTFGMLKEVAQQAKGISRLLRQGKVDKLIDDLKPWQEHIEGALDSYQSLAGQSSKTSQVPDELGEVLRLFQLIKNDVELEEGENPLEQGSLLLKQALEDLKESQTAQAASAPAMPADSASQAISTDDAQQGAAPAVPTSPSTAPSDDTEHAQAALAASIRQRPDHLRHVDMEAEAAIRESAREEERAFQQRDQLLGDIRAGAASLKKATAPQPAPAEQLDPRSQLMASIRAGTGLRKVDPAQEAARRKLADAKAAASQKPAASADDSMALLRGVLGARRGAIAQDTDSDSERKARFRERLAILDKVVESGDRQALIDQWNREDAQRKRDTFDYKDNEKGWMKEDDREWGE